ncbi:RQC domain-containing protein [candidate division KSB1 bacterium]
MFFTESAILKTPLKQEFYDLLISEKVKFTASIGPSKEEKTIAIYNKLAGPGLIIAPDTEHLNHIMDVLDNRSIRCACYSKSEDPEENQNSLISLNSGEIDLLVADEICLSGLPKFGFKYIVHWVFPFTVREFLSSVQNFSMPDKDTYSIILYEPDDRYFREECLLSSVINIDENRVSKQRVFDLNRMEEYINTIECRTGFLLNEIGKSGVHLCANCDNCKRNTSPYMFAIGKEEEIVTLLICIHETREKFGLNILSDVLRGKYSKKVEEYDLHKASTFGKFPGKRIKDIKDLFDILHKNGYIRKTTGVLPAIYLSKTGKNLIRDRIAIPVTLPKKMIISDYEEIDVSLMEIIRNFRRAYSKKLNIPAYRLFPDSVLKEIVKKCPQTESELKQAKGFGEKTFNTCGGGLLKVLREYAEKNKM